MNCAFKLHDNNIFNLYNSKISKSLYLKNNIQVEYTGGDNTDTVLYTLELVCVSVAEIL